MHNNFEWKITLKIVLTVIAILVSLSIVFFVFKHGFKTICFNNIINNSEESSLNQKVINNFDSLTIVWNKQGKAPFTEKDALWEYDYEGLVIYDEDSTWGKSWFYEVGKNENIDFSYIRPYFFKKTSDSIIFFTNLPRYKSFLVNKNGKHWTKEEMQEEFYTLLKAKIQLDCDFNFYFRREMFKDTVKFE